MAPGRYPVGPHRLLPPPAMPIRHPLRFKPLPQQRVWGGNRLADLLQGDLDCPSKTGEVWSVSARTGAASEVAAGPLEGRTLMGLMMSEQDALLGTSARSAEGGFPLLVKYLDSSEILSLQVHPDEGMAARLKTEPKDECWYVIAADPKSVLYLGLREGVDAATFAAAKSNGDFIDLLQCFTPRPGDFFHVPAGTLHAIGAGLTLIEIQQNSDTTYRVHDWERAGLDGNLRELHRDEALQATHFGRDSEGLLRSTGSEQRTNSHMMLLDSGPFFVEWMRVLGPCTHSTDGRAWLYVVLAGSGDLCMGEHDGKRGETERMTKGQVWLLPADVGEYSIIHSDGELELLRVEARA